VVDGVRQNAALVYLTPQVHLSHIHESSVCIPAPAWWNPSASGPV